jgi:hypothetical protein
MIETQTIKTSIEVIEAEIEENNFLSPSMELEALAVLAARRAMLKQAQDAADEQEA